MYTLLIQRIAINDSLCPEVIESRGDNHISHC